MKSESCEEMRIREVRKSNELIQRSRFRLSLQQQRVMLYLISKIGYDDDEFHEYEFNIPEFCRVCGIPIGSNYNDLKAAIRDISDKSMWVYISENTETLLRWIEKPYINKDCGTIKIRLDRDMKPFLLELKSHYTSYELIYTLMFSSKYSIRLYEVCRSHLYDKRKVFKYAYDIEELRQLLDCENYTDFRNFRRRVLDIAIKDINENSDMNVSYNKKTQGRKVVKIEFVISTKQTVELMRLQDRIHKELGTDQMTMWEIFQQFNQKRMDKSSSSR